MAETAVATCLSWESNEHRLHNSPISKIKNSIRITHNTNTSALVTETRGQHPPLSLPKLTPYIVNDQRTTSSTHARSSPTPPNPPKVGRPTAGPTAVATTTTTGYWGRDVGDMDMGTERCMRSDLRLSAAPRAGVAARASCATCARRGPCWVLCMWCRAAVRARESRFPRARDLQGSARMPVRVDMPPS
eukprot:scaffold12458_cov132-Isochrysis_galbana.AAC.3